MSGGFIATADVGTAAALDALRVQPLEQATQNNHHTDTKRASCMRLSSQRVIVRKKNSRGHLHVHVHHSEPGEVQCKGCGGPRQHPVLHRLVVQHLCLLLLPPTPRPTLLELPSQFTKPKRDGCSP
jgi:hypothetical protein